MNLQVFSRGFSFFFSFQDLLSVLRRVVSVLGAEGERGESNTKKYFQQSSLVLATLDIQLLAIAFSFDRSPD